MSKARNGDAGDNFEATSYTADSIQVQSWHEAIRRRPGMYLRDADSAKGLCSLVEALLDALDALGAATARPADRILVELGPNNALALHQDGAALPLEPHPQRGAPMAEVLMTGHWLCGDGGACFGLSIVNALSDELELRIWRDSGAYYARYERGDVITPLARVGASEGRVGVEIMFVAAPSVFRGALHDFTLLEEHLRARAAMAPHTRIALLDQREGRIRKRVFMQG